MRPRNLLSTMFEHLRSASRASRLGAGLLLVLLLSTAALAFLTFQSVRSETIAQRHLVEETHQQIATIVSAQIDSRIAELDEELVGELSNSGSEQLLIERLHRAEANRAWLMPAVLLRQDGTVFYPRQGARASGGAFLSLDPSTGRNSEFEQRFELAETVELRDGEIERAITLYSTALEIAATSEEKVRALNGLARCEFNAGRYDRALEAYDRLISTASTVQYSQANLALVAHFQRVSSFEGLENPSAASQAAVGLLEFLLEHRFLVDYDFYTLYRREVETKLTAMSLTDEQTNRVNDLMEREQQLDMVASHHEAFRSTLEQLPLRTLANNESSDMVQRVDIPGVDDRIVSLAKLGSLVQPATTESRSSVDNDISAAGGQMLLAHEWTAEDVVGIISNLITNPGSAIATGVALVAPSGDPYFSSAEILLLDLAAVSAPLKTLPAWRVAAFPATGSIDALATEAVRQHVLLLGLVSLTVVASLLLAAWGISHELALSRLRSEFVSSVSHEFRTPLALVHMYAESLEEGWIDKSELTATYQKIRRETTRLTGLINNMLDFSKIERGTQEYQLEEVDLRELIAEVVERYQPQLTAAEITLEKDIPPLPIKVRIDREAMGGVLLNLLSNAAKYMGDGEKKVSISLFTQGERAGFSVSDTGIGMESTEIERIYDRYYRTDSEQVRSVAGSGIGLTVVRSVVEGHGGSISVHSAPSEGSTFTVILPLVQAGAQ